jgi:hypothetical protein
MTTGVSWLRAFTSCTSKLRVRSPTKTPSSPLSDPSGGLRPRRFRSRLKFCSESRPSKFRPLSSFHAISASASPSLSRNEPRTMSINGRKGVCCPSGTQLLESKNVCRSSIRCRNSWTSLDLPIPGSAARCFLYLGQTTQGAHRCLHQGLQHHCRSVCLDQVGGPSKTPQTTFRASMIPGTRPYYVAAACCTPSNLSFWRRFSTGLQSPQTGRSAGEVRCLSGTRRRDWRIILYGGRRGRRLIG